MRFIRDWLPRLVFAVLAMAAVAAAGAQAAQVAGRTFTLEVTPGPEYHSTSTILLFIRIPVYPQIACWLETPDGQFVATVYVTSKGGKKDFYAAPQGGRPEALPVWYHRQAGSRGAVDAVTAATAASAADHRASLQLPPGTYVAFLEVNRAYDYNGQFTRANSGVNGQPSVIYRADLTVGSEPARAAFAPVGTGSLDGSDGTIRAGLDGITTALDLIAGAEIDCKGVSP